MIHLIIAALITAGGIMAAPPPTAYIIQEPTYSGGEVVEQGWVESMDRERLSYLMDTLERLNAEEVAATDRARRAWQIDDYLAGSPMAGLGSTIVANAERTGVNPFLAPAVAEAESSLGRACLSRYNCWGWLAKRSGFASWEDSISQWFTFVLNTWGPVQSSREMRGYCQPNEPWMSNVERVANAISIREGFGGGGSSAW